MQNISKTGIVFSQEEIWFRAKKSAEPINLHLAEIKANTD